MFVEHSFALFLVGGGELTFSTFLFRLGLKLVVNWNSNKTLTKIKLLSLCEFYYVSNRQFSMCSCMTQFHWETDLKRLKKRVHLL